MPDLRGVAAAAGGAALGGAARFALTVFVVSRFGAAFAPGATLAINVSGSFLIGVVLESVRLGDGDPLVRIFLATGILGGYTTFSTFSYETLALWERAPGTAALYVAGSVGLGVAATLAGIAAARAVVH